MDMFPQTDELSDIKMNVSSHVETIVSTKRKHVENFRFRHFSHFMEFDTDGDKFRKRILKELNKS